MNGRQPGAPVPLNAEQQALLALINEREFDVALGMLERRMDRDPDQTSTVRQAVADILRETRRHAPIHSSLVRLANRGTTTTLVTTNFDLLFEAAARALRTPLTRYALQDIPRPTLRPEFSGVLHLHGALDPNPSRHTDLVLTDRDFGERYLRRRAIPDFIYDASRIFHIVLVGYSLADPPMRYLLSAVAADGSHFPDLKERFAFVPIDSAHNEAGREAKALCLATWAARGITPIPYDKSNGHGALADVLSAWADLSPHFVPCRAAENEVRRVFRIGRAGAADTSRDLFAHLFRRGAFDDQVRIAAEGRKVRSDPAWLDGMLEIVREAGPELNRERHAFQLCMVWLDGRLDDKAALKWAVSLPAGADTERRAVLETVEWGIRKQEPAEPWRSAWRAVAEALRTSKRRGRSEDYTLGQRIAGGERSGLLVADLAHLVSPRLEVGWRDTPLIYGKSPPKKPKRVEDLLSLRVASNTVDVGGALCLEGVPEAAFLVEVAEAVEAEVVRGLRVGARAGWHVDRDLVWLGGLGRLRLRRGLDAESAERFTTGIAPGARLLLHAVACLAALDPAAAAPILRRWRTRPDPVHARLWAAAAIEPSLVDGAEVASFLNDQPPRRVWDTYRFPEIAELRASRFASLGEEHRGAIARTLLRGPPAAMVRRAGPPDDRRRLRDGLVVRELTRIEATGTVLPPKAGDWLQERRAAFGDFVASEVDAGFPAAAHAYWAPPNHDIALDRLEGSALAAAVHQCLGSRGTAGRRAEGVWNWLNIEGNALRLAEALLIDDQAAERFPEVWAAAYSRHRAPGPHAGETPGPDAVERARRLLAPLLHSPEASLAKMASGVATWLEGWARHLAPNDALTAAIARLWPWAIAESETSVDAGDYEEADGAEAKRLEIDALNSPIGQLTGAFLNACPNLNRAPDPLRSDAGLQRLAALVAATAGRSGGVTRFRCAMRLPYFLRADPEWTEATLILPLERGGSEADALWRAVTHSGLSPEALARLGVLMARRAMVAGGLDRETRLGLVDRACSAALSALWHARCDTGLLREVEQMLRVCSDEERSRAAAIPEQVLGAPGGTDGPALRSREEVFERVVEPFLREVWPKDQSGATPSVAAAFASLPAAAGRRFAEAVAAVRRYLVPFEAWSTHAWSLDAENQGEGGLDVILGPTEARAALDLLDRTIGAQAGARVPSGLDLVLASLAAKEANLKRDGRFRRLAALSSGS